MTEKIFKINLEGDSQQAIVCGNCDYKDTMIGFDSSKGIKGEFLPLCPKCGSNFLFFYQPDADLSLNDDGNYK